MFFIYKLMCYLFYMFYGEEMSINIDLNIEQSDFALLHYRLWGFFNVINLMYTT